MNFKIKKQAVIKVEYEFEIEADSLEESIQAVKEVNLLAFWTDEEVFEYNNSTLLSSYGNWDTILETTKQVIEDEKHN